MLVRLPHLPLSHPHTGRACILPPRPLSVLHLTLDEATSAQVDFLQSIAKEDYEEDLDSIWVDS